MLNRSIFALLTAVSLGFAGSAQAVVMNDQDVTNEVIFGSGNANGAFTVDRANGIELGLRGKLRFNDSNNPENTFNSNGDGTYSFSAGTPPTGFSFDPNSPTTPVWSFEWSVNTDFDGTTGAVLNDLIYQLQIDFDPGAGEQFQSFDPINVASADHAIGDNGTGNGAGTEAANATEYAALIAGNNLAQNSWNMEFFNDSPPYDAFDPNVPGVYTIVLSAFDGNEGLLSSVSIDILVTEVPEPSTIALMLLGLLGLGAFSWRRAAAT